MRIFKYPLEVGINEVTLPEKHTILSVKELNGKTVMYALVDEDANNNSEYTFYVAMTGEWVQENYAFIGTVIHPAGKHYAIDIVLHLFNCGKA